MSDRVPLEEVVDKPLESKPMEDRPKKEIDTGERGVRVGTRVVGISIDEFRIKKEISAMLGFEDGYFEGMGKEGDLIYRWAMEMSKENEKEPLIVLGKMLRSTGLTYRGKPLLKKLALWVTFDSQARALREKSALKEKIALKEKRDSLTF